MTHQNDGDSDAGAGQASGLSAEEMDAQQAIDLPDRAALSLLDVSKYLGSTTLPTSATGATPDPTSTTAAPTTGPSTSMSFPELGSLGDIAGGL